MNQNWIYVKRNNIYVKRNLQKLKLPITIIEGNVPTLMGRNWLMKLTLDWKKLLKKDNSEGGPSGGPSRESDKRPGKEAKVKSSDESRKSDEAKSELGVKSSLLNREHRTNEAETRNKKVEIAKKE